MSSFHKIREDLSTKACSIIVFGASGHLAKTKTYPSLFDIFSDGMLPDDFQCIGYGRSKLDKQAFHERISMKLKGKLVAEFLSHCTYFRGKAYDDATSLKGLGQFISEQENNKYKGKSNRLFYLAVPPEVFGAICGGIKKFLACDPSDGWTRIMIEKPFGSDSESSSKLMASIDEYYGETEIYRVDHYLAKEMIQNLISLRFGNIIWQNIWNNKYIKCVKISMKETNGVDGRGGYYDENGVIRDILQNHLLQILTLIAMERPISLNGDDIRDEKVKVLKCIEVMNEKKTIVGQYKGYRDDPTTNNLSNQITFAQTIFFIDNYRWNGVPFICKCGKGLDSAKVEVRIQFKNKGILSLFNKDININSNELVIRIQPDPKIYLKFNSKIPGYARFDKIKTYELDLTYYERFGDKLKLPAAYTRLIIDCLCGDQSLFVRGDELKESWRIVTPFLYKLKNENKEPIFYKRGSRGPIGADQMAKQFGFEISKDYQYRTIKSKL